MLSIEVNVPNKKLGCFATTQLIRKLLMSTSHHRHSINRVVPNNHHLNLHLKLRIFMQQNWVGC